MRIRAWVCHALTGDVLGELTLSGGSSFQNRFGGGTCRLSVSLAHLTTRDGLGVDWAAVSGTHDRITPGRSTVLITAGTQVLGEWIVMQSAVSDPASTLDISGMEWAGYPALRSLNDNFHHENVEQMVIARKAWNQAFLSFNGAMAITIPTSGSTGVTRNMDHDSHGAYYSDVLEEIADAEDGFEWHVDVSATFSGDVPTRANRQVVWGAPVLQRGSPLALNMFEPGSRQGNLMSVSGGLSFARYAQSVYGIGAGEGDDRRWVGLSDPSGTNAGNLNSTKNVSFPGISDTPTLTKLTQAELERAQDLRDPYEVTARLDKLPTLPRVGYAASVNVTRSLAFPAGLSETLRIGQVDYSPSGHEVSTVSLLAA